MIDLPWLLQVGAEILDEAQRRPTRICGSMASVIIVSYAFLLEELRYELLDYYVLCNEQSPYLCM